MAGVAGTVRVSAAPVLVTHFLVRHLGALSVSYPELDLEVMADRLALTEEDLAPTEAVLSEHGNMSSVTVLFVLDQILRCQRPRPGERGLLGAFGPGFGAELALLEFS